MTQRSSCDYSSSSSSSSSSSVCVGGMSKTSHFAPAVSAYCLYGKGGALTTDYTYIPEMC